MNKPLHSGFGDSAGPDSPPASIPDHELLRCVGSGSYGEVWLARNLVGTARAIKIVRRDRFERAADFEREFKGLQNFEPVSRTHEGLSGILTLGRLCGIDGFFYVMELADDASTSSRLFVAEVNPTLPSSAKSEGKAGLLSLETYLPLTMRVALRAHTAFPSDRLLDLALKLTAAVAHLHSQGLVHRDIKPSNILFIGGEPKVADAGLVAAMDDARSLVGTAGYIAPEGPGSPQADLYALGKVLYEAAFGKDRQDFPQLPPDLRSRPDHARLLEFNQIVLKACATNPRERYPSADEMLSELELLHKGKSVKQKRARSQWLRLGMKLGLIAGVLTITAVTMQQMFLRRGTKSPQGPPSKLSQNPEAMRLYEVARWQFNRTPGEVSQEAIQAVESAIVLYPKFVQAYALRFEMLTWTFSLPRQEMAVKTREIGDKLMAIDPSLGEAHAAHGWSEFCEFNWEKAEKELQTCLRLSPNYGMGYCLYALILTTEGRGEEARPYYKRAVELDSTSQMLVVVAGFPDFYSRRYTDAIAQFEKALKLESNSGFALGWIGLCYETSGDYPNAIKTYEKMAVLNGEDPATVIARFNGLNAAFSAKGELGYWENRLHLFYPSDDTDPQDMALVAVHLGRKQEALGCLEKAFDSLAYTASWLKTDPNWDPLRNETRFKDMLRRARFTE